MAVAVQILIGKIQIEMLAGSAASQGVTGANLIERISMVQQHVAELESSRPELLGLAERLARPIDDARRLLSLGDEAH